MKKYKLISLVLFVCGSLFSQQEFDHAHCDCVDVIEEISPNLNGNYQRICNEIVVEEGIFDNGLKNGLWIVRSKKGEIIRKFNYLSGKLEGKVELFYPNGKNKMIGFFKNSLKEDKWEFFNEKGRIIKEGLYENGIAKGIWKIYNWKGKKVIIEYNFDKEEYKSSDIESNFFEDSAVLQNDNSTEWFIQVYPSRDNNFKEFPIEGYRKLNDVYANMIEIPLEIWETYLSINYFVDIKFENGAMKEVELSKGDKHVDDVPILSFVVITNDIDKLTKVNHTELSLKLLEYKIKEAIWLTGPWLNTGDSLRIYTPYVINQIENRKF